MVDVFSLPTYVPPRIDPPGRRMYERLVKQINEFEAGLRPDEEVGGRLVTAPGDRTLHIDDVGVSGDMIIFHARDEDGRPAQLLQHYTQVNVLLVPLRTTEPEPRRIGFHLMGKLEPKA